MKNRFTLRILALLIALVITLSTFASCDIWGGGVSNTTASQKTDEWENYDSEHSDVNNDGFCDDCQIDVVETIDFLKEQLEVHEDKGKIYGMIAHVYHHRVVSDCDKVAEYAKKSIACNQPKGEK